MSYAIDIQNTITGHHSNNLLPHQKCLPMTFGPTSHNNSQLPIDKYTLSFIARSLFTVELNWYS